MSGGVTEALRGWIRAYDLWLNEGEGEAPTVDSLCEVADAIDLAVQDEVHEQVVRCRDCDYRRSAWNGRPPNFVSDFFCSYTGGHEVKPDGFCAWGEFREG